MSTSTGTTETVRFRAGGGSAPGHDGAPVLEGRLRRPSTPAVPPRIAVLAHPHPAFGGHMDVWLLPTIGARLARDGWTVLRFNVRGVGGSEPGPGSWDGSEERHDLAGALAALRARVPDEPDRTAVVGWSFGALLGLLHGPGDPTVTHWVGVSPPTRALRAAPMAAVPLDRVRRWPARRIVIVGEHDQFFPPASMCTLAPDAVHVVPGADHFLFDRDDEVAELIARALAEPPA